MSIQQYRGLVESQGINPAAPSRYSQSRRQQRVVTAAKRVVESAHAAKGLTCEGNTEKEGEGKLMEM